MPKIENFLWGIFSYSNVVKLLISWVSKLAKILEVFSFFRYLLKFFFVFFKNCLGRKATPPIEMYGSEELYGFQQIVLSQIKCFFI